MLVLMKWTDVAEGVKKRLHIVNYLISVHASQPIGGLQGTILKKKLIEMASIVNMSLIAPIQIITKEVW